MKCSCGSELKSNGHCSVQKCPWGDKTHPKWFLNKLADGGVFYELTERNTPMKSKRWLGGTGK